MLKIIVSFVLGALAFFGVRAMLPLEYRSAEVQAEAKAEKAEEARIAKIQADNAALVSFQRLGCFSDSSAYGEQRCTYMVKYTPTGQTFIGVSGIGISELGNHTVQSGKNRVTREDER